MAEAGLPVAAIALLTDLHGRRGLSRALAALMLAPFVGGGLALLIGGQLYPTLARGALPFGLAGWRALFILAGLPGLLLAPLVACMVVDPDARNRHLDERRRGQAAGRTRRAGVGETPSLLTWTALVPVKPPGTRKTRLAAYLDANERDLLVERMLDRAIEAIAATRQISRIVIVSPAPFVGRAFTRYAMPAPTSMRRSRWRIDR